MSGESGIGSVQQVVSSTTQLDVKSATQAGSTQVSARRGAESVSALGQSDRANLSSASGLVGQALETSDARLDKVVSLQDVISAGSYSVQSSDVADKIISSLLS
jgi:negative regulator of flagellin synthesis FlgM